MNFNSFDKCWFCDKTLYSSDFEKECIFCHKQIIYFVDCDLIQPKIVELLFGTYRLVLFLYEDHCINIESNVRHILQLNAKIIFHTKDLDTFDFSKTPEDIEQKIKMIAAFQ